MLPVVEASYLSKIAERRKLRYNNNYCKYNFHATGYLSGRIFLRLYDSNVLPILFVYYIFTRYTDPRAIFVKDVTTRYNNYYSQIIF